MITDGFVTVLSNKYFNFNKKYVKIKVEANDVDTFVKIVKYIEKLDELQEDY